MIKILFFVRKHPDSIRISLKENESKEVVLSVDTSTQYPKSNSGLFKKHASLLADFLKEIISQHSDKLDDQNKFKSLISFHFEFNQKPYFEYLFHYKAGIVEESDSIKDLSFLESDIQYFYKVFNFVSNDMSRKN